MTIFWVVAVCLIVAALLFVMPPLLARREVAARVDHAALNISVYQSQLAELDQDLANGTVDQAQYERNRHELERRLLQDVEQEDTANKSTPKFETSRQSAIALLVLIPVVSVFLYKELGTPHAITGEPAPMAAAENVEHPDTGQQIEAMVASLATRLQENPDDYQGWFMLARSYQFLNKPQQVQETLAKLRERLQLLLDQDPNDITGLLYMATAYRMERKHDQAVTYYRQAMPFIQAAPEQFGENLPDLLGDIADSLALAGGGTLAGEPMEVINWALSIKPDHIQSLWLAGTYYYETQEYAKALEYWTRIRALVPADSQEAQTMDGNIAEVRAKLAAAGQAVPEASASEPPPASPGTAQVSGVVRLDPSFTAQVSPGDTLFVFARAPNGPRMPLAIMRTTAADLPLTFTLDESMSMMPSMSLANFPEVEIGARISRTGNAMPQSGDLEGMVASVAVGTSGLDITINRVVP